MLKLLYRNKWKILFSMFLNTILFALILLMYFELNEFVLGKQFLPFNTLSDLDSKLYENYTINQPGCRIPGMNEKDDEIKEKFEVKMERLKCDKYPPALIKDDKNSLNVDQLALKHYNIRLQNLNCTFQSFDRPVLEINESPLIVDKSIVYSEEIKSLPIDRPVEINDEFVEVRCEDSSNKTYRPAYLDYFAFVPIKNEIEERCEKFRQDDDRLNVMIIGIDSLSRLNFHRQMPFAARYLKNEMEAIEMFGYNKIGDNTFPNVVALLTGLDWFELRKLYWTNESDFFDNCPFIWKLFQQHGYRTTYAEDAAFMATFNYLKRGFRASPTDYYIRPFIYQSEEEIGNTRPGNAFLCCGSRIYLKVMLDYALKHAHIFHQRNYFGLFWSSSFTHDYFNLPAEGDEIVLEFLQKLHQNASLLNYTALIILSDHGMRYGDFRKTFQGHLEESLPLLMFVLPQWFRQSFKMATKNLYDNAFKLTTPFDLYEMLHDFSNLTRLNEVQITNRTSTKHGYVQRQQQSLFLPISAYRTCFDAGIPKHFCTCHDRMSNVNTNDSHVITAATVLVNYLNTILAPYSNCHRLSLQMIEQATVETVVSDTDIVLYYIIIISTYPGDALFESTVKYEYQGKNGNQIEEKKGNFTVVGHVSRINEYGDQSTCVTDSLIRLYCFCK